MYDKSCQLYTELLHHDFSQVIVDVVVVFTLLTFWSNCFILAHQDLNIRVTDITDLCCEKKEFLKYKTNENSHTNQVNVGSCGYSVKFQLQGCLDDYFVVRIKHFETNNLLC